MGKLHRQLTCQNSCQVQSDRLAYHLPGHAACTIAPKCFLTLHSVRAAMLTLSTCFVEGRDLPVRR